MPLAFLDQVNIQTVDFDGMSRFDDPDGNHIEIQFAQREEGKTHPFAG